MKSRLLFTVLLLAIVAGLVSCEKEDEPGDFFGGETSDPMLIIRFKFDETEQTSRKQGSTLPGNAAQTPDYNSIAADFIQFTTTKDTASKSGIVAYQSPKTTMGGSEAIDFGLTRVVEENRVFVALPIKKLKTGNYRYVNVSIAFQNYKIKIRNNAADYDGTMAGFTGFNTYIDTYEIGNNIFPVNANKTDGYWAFALDDFPYQAKGQITDNIISNSGNDAGLTKSRLITGKFTSDLVITGKETSNIEVTLTLPVAHTFQWKEVIFDGKFEPSIGEQIINLGANDVVASFR